MKPSGTLAGRHTLAESIEEEGILQESIYTIRSLGAEGATLGTAKYKPKVLLEKVLSK